MTGQILIQAIGSCLISSCPPGEAQKPNVIIILADDLGLGDVSAYGSETISTPNIDCLAREGVCFSNGYATSATSTPSRYAMMTGMYPWKNSEARILPGDAPLIIHPKQFTLPGMMRDNGYTTGAVGKWHLGMGEGNVDWNERVVPGANEIGFDYSCLIAATNDRVPTVYVENGYVLGLEEDDPIEVSYDCNFEGEPTALSHPGMLRMEWSHGHNNSIVNGIPRIGFMKGGNSARWHDEEMADFFVSKVKDFIGECKDGPFFLYYGLHQPHVPRAPHKRFNGATSMGPRGDAIIEADWCVGELISYLEEAGILENTLIIFSSDNGPVIDDGYKDMAEELLGNHDPKGGFRGGKYSLFDAGTHVPFFVYWKGTIKPALSGALVCHLDFAASLGELVGGQVPAGLDSRNLLDALLGKNNLGRNDLVIEAQGRLAMRSGDWVFIPPYDGPERNLTGNELGNLDSCGLYNITKEPAQQNNLASEEPGILDRLEARFLEITKGYYKGR